MKSDAVARRNSHARRYITLNISRRQPIAVIAGRKSPSRKRVQLHILLTYPPTQIMRVYLDLRITKRRTKQRKYQKKTQIKAFSEHFAVMKCCLASPNSDNEDENENDDINNRNSNGNVDGAAPAASGSAPNYWKMRLRSRMAVAGRRMSAVVGMAPLDGALATVPAPLRRRSSFPVLSSTIELLRSEATINSISSIELLASEATVISALSNSCASSVIPQEPPRVPPVLEPHDECFEIPRYIEKWHNCNNLQLLQYSLLKFFFALQSNMVRILSAARMDFNHRSLLDLRILVNLLLILALFSQTASGATLKTNCRKVGYQHIIDEPRCDLVAVYLNRCSGYCSSFSFPDPHQNNRVVAFAKCCRMTDVELIDVKVNCGQDGGVRTVKVPSARECECFDCVA